ncbi:MAG: hypothetical protein HOL98_10640 [Gammaproteobacteria bacterium]|nr:hypothetical protein [Gammaproteobacteria bacterium]
MHKIQEQFRKFEDCIWVIAVFILCYGLTFYPMLSVQNYFIADAPRYSLLLFLPHGVRIIATWLLGARAILPLLLSSWLCSFVYGHSSATFSLWPALISSIAPYIAFKMFQFAGLPNFATKESINLGWKTLILTGFFAAMLNATGTMILFQREFSFSDSNLFISTYIVGDMLGLIFFMGVTMLIFRWFRPTDLQAPRTF